MISKELVKHARKISYFPIKLIICAAFFTFIFLEFDFIEPLEEQTLISILQFFQIQSYYLDGDLFIGNIYAAEHFIIPEFTHTLFLIFFPSVMLATRASLTIRLKFIFYGVLCFISFILLEFLMILIMGGLGIGNSVSYLHANVVFSGLVAGLVIEMSLLGIITLPKSEKITPIVKRSYKNEYAYLAILLFFSALIIYAIFNILDIREDTVVTAYVALSLSTILTFKYYISYFMWEIKKPVWAKLQLKKQPVKKRTKVSFLLPAYNEEKTVTKLLQSIDSAASKYDGDTEIILINDGSTDNTESLSNEAMGHLKYSQGNTYTIKNSGKGFALQYGLQKVTGEIIFRIDADSRVDENVINYVVRHYDDPTVGSVSGMIFPIEEKSIWQKSMVFLGCLNMFYRKGMNLIESILVQPGAFSTFRTEALEKVGGWTHNQMGEDGEITIRLGRYGYRSIFEEHAVTYSEAPNNINELREQRVRWAVAFYHSRAKNMNVIKEFNGPRSLMVIFGLLSHGGGFAQTLIWPFFIVALFLDDSVSTLNLVSLIGIPTQLVIVDILVFSLLYVILIRYLYRFKKLYLVKYLPFLRIYFFILGTFFKPEAMELLLQHSSKWKYHTEVSHKELIKRLKRNVRGNKIKQPVIDNS